MAVKKWAKITREEWEMVKELRAIRKGNKEPVHWFTIAGPLELAEDIGGIVENAVEAYHQPHKGQIVAFVAKAAFDARKRAGQYRYFLQALHHAFGPQREEEVPVFYPPAEVH